MACSRALFRRGVGGCLASMPVPLHMQHVSAIIVCFRWSLWCIFCWRPEGVVDKRPLEDVAVVSKISKATRFQPPVATVGPRAAVAELDRINDSSEEWSIWIEEARLHALLGSCRASIASVKSGIRCYVAFAGALLLYLGALWCPSVCCADSSGLKNGGRYFPPTVDALLAWSRCFGHSRTWQNYLGYVRTACLVADAPVEGPCSGRITGNGCVCVCCRFSGTRH